MRIRTGERFYDPSTDRYAIVIETGDEDGPKTAVVQYDDGTPGVKAFETLSNDFLPLPSLEDRTAQSLSDACLEGNHEFDELSRNIALKKDDAEHSPRCGCCGLSAAVLRQCLGHSIAASFGDVCHYCRADIDSGISHHDHEDRPICSECWDKYDEVWKMPADKLCLEFAFYHPSCGWFSEERPPNGRECPSCGGERVTIISTDSPTYRTVKRHSQDEA